MLSTRFLVFDTFVYVSEVNDASTLLQNQVYPLWNCKWVSTSSNTKIGIERSVNSKESTLKETTTNKTNFQNVCILSFVIQFFHWNTSWFQKADHDWLKGEKILKFKSLVHLWSVFLVYFCGSVTIMRHMVLLTHPSPLDILLFSEAATKSAFG